MIGLQKYLRLSKTRRGSKIDFFAVLTILCGIEWSSYAYSKSNMLEVFREGLFEYRYYLALINATA